MIVRVFDTVVDPLDVEHGTQLFRDVVRPAFEGFAGCRGIEMLLGVDEHSMDLVSVLAISRWDSREAIEAAVSSTAYEAALADLQALFQQTPLVRHFESLD